MSEGEGHEKKQEIKKKRKLIISDFLFVQSAQETFGLSCYEWLQGTLSVVDECININT